MRKVIVPILALLLAASVRAQEPDSWILIDSVSFQARIPAGERCCVYFDRSAESLRTVPPDDGLIQPARDAVAKAPDWLQFALEDNFARIGSTYQMLYANLILDAVDPCVDEIAFTVAHLAPQTLTSSSMNIDMLLENAECVYMNDAALDYVTIVDSGDALEGGNYFSTTWYAVGDSSSDDTTVYVLPREIYYWFIVNPKLHKEFPGYVNPATGGLADPPTGKFWRNWLFNEAESGYPILKDRLAGCQTLWESRENNIDNGAVGVVTQWMKDVMEFISTSHHDQPVRIYHQHRGTCSVWAYLTSGVARACLIPATVTVAYRNNHKWNEFYERRWVHWEPVNTWMDAPYRLERMGSVGQLRSVFNWRGDGYCWTANEQYTTVCTLVVDVDDVNGNPVDGARIIIDGPGYPGPRATFGLTSSSGQCRFLLGDSISWFSGNIESDVGSEPTTTIITNSQPGMLYTWDVDLTGSIPQLQAEPDTMPTSPRNDFMFEFRFDVPGEFDYAMNPDDGDMFSESFSPGNLDFFICDSGNYETYVSGGSFRAFRIAEDATSGESTFVLPTDDRWSMVLSNEDASTATGALDIQVKLYQQLTGIAEGVVFRAGPASCRVSPNPFSGTTMVYATGAVDCRKGVQVWDASGRLVRRLPLDSGVGLRTCCWDGTDDAGQRLSPGVYFVCLEHATGRLRAKAILTD